MIKSFSGIPGNGMTYETVEKALEDHQLRRVFCANIDRFLDSSCLEMVKTACGFPDLAIKKPGCKS